MSLSKFLDLISRKALFMSQLSVLQRDDPFEGSLGADRLAYLQRMMQDDDFARRELGVPPDQPIRQELRNAFAPAMTAWQNARSAEHIYVNCWHVNPVESAHLWAAYAAHGEGVAVRSTIGALKASLTNTSELTIAPVRYIDHQTYRMGPSFEDAAFYKRLSFKAERELRLRYVLPIEECLREVGGQRFWRPPPGVYMDVDCGQLIERVHVSPTLGNWFRDTVERLLSELGLHKEVVKSAITDPRIL